MIAATKPDKPPKPTLVSQSPTQIQIAWNASADGGSEITDYIVLSGTDGSSFTPLAPTTGSRLIRSYSITSTQHLISTGTQYHFKVVAVNAVDQSTPSDAIQVYAA